MVAIADSAAQNDQSIRVTSASRITRCGQRGEHVGDPDRNARSDVEGLLLPVAEQNAEPAGLRQCEKRFAAPMAQVRRLRDGVAINLYAGKSEGAGPDQLSGFDVFDRRPGEFAITLIDFSDQQ